MRFYNTFQAKILTGKYSKFLTCTQRPPPFWLIMQPLNASIGELLQKNMPRCIKIQLRLEEILKTSRMHELGIRNTDRAMIVPARRASWQLSSISDINYKRVCQQFTSQKSAKCINISNSCAQTHSHLHKKTLTLEKYSVEVKKLSLKSSQPAHSHEGQQVQKCLMGHHVCVLFEQSEARTQMVYPQWYVLSCLSKIKDFSIYLCT